MYQYWTGHDLSVQGLPMFKSRKRNRLKGFDYSTEAIYFVTICCGGGMHYFGKIQNGEMNLNEAGNVALNQINWLQEQYLYCIIHNAVVMPNHLHILLEIDKSKVNSDIKIKSLSSLMGAYKTTVSKQIHLAGNEDFSWHRSFHDHIVRNDASYERIFDYISENPKKWSEDKFFNF